MQFRQATSKDFNDIWRIIEEGRRRIAKLDISQWQDGDPSREVIERDLATNKSYVVEDAGKILMTMSLGFDGEPAYDDIKNGTWLDDEDYLVIHRVAVADEALNQGIAKWAMLEAEKIALERNVHSVRIDTHEGNVPMRALIRSCRYTYTGEISFGPENPRIAFQKRKFLGEVPPTYNTLLFDADGTLLDFDHAERQALYYVVEKMGGKWTDELGTSYNEINDSYWKKFERNEIEKKDLLIARFEEFIRRWHLPGEAKDWAASYQPQLGKGFKTIPYAINILERLKNRVDLHVITNGEIETQRSRLAGSKIRPYFDHVFVSEDIGYQKPDTRYFEHVKKTLSLENLEDVIVIGDSLTSDIKGGKEAGIDTCWYNPQELKEDPEISPKYTIADLREVMYFVK